MRKIRALVVGQTPPPYYGQAIMIEKLTQAAFDSIEVVHLRMCFSDTVEEIGKAQWKKVFRLFRLLFHGIYLLLFRKIDVLYYPPAGPHLIPILRDMIILPFWRLLAPKVLYHFRAGGISEFLKKGSGLIRGCARVCYGKPDAAILLSRFNPNDAKFFEARQIHIVPNGLDDFFSPNTVARNENEVRIFYIGLLHEEKGIHTLLDAFRLVTAKHDNVSLHLAGQFQNSSDRDAFLSRAQEYGVRDRITLHGLVTHQTKWQLFAKMDVMCFLTHYSAESFGNSVLEAMIWEMPVIATAWRGVQDLVVDQETGYLVPIQDARAAAEKASLLIADPALRIRLGKRGRERFLQEFTLEKHLKRMENAILSSVATSGLSVNASEI
jgi:glycosyltransferase involved in cell wall biosynthesis